jgi:hypothetical protein
MQNNVRTYLKSYRHDLAGRIHALLALEELLDTECEKILELIPNSAPIETISMLRNVRNSWSYDLSRCDHLLTAEPFAARVDGITLSSLINLDIPIGQWFCDPTSLSETIKHINKSLGHLGLKFHKPIVRTTLSNVDIIFHVGEIFDRETKRMSLAFPGDIDAAFAEAEARISMIELRAAQDNLGATVIVSISSN